MLKDDVIKAALDSYNNCKILISNLCLSISEILKNNDFYESANNETREVIDYYKNSFSTEWELQVFDYMLQALLISQALVDGDFCDAEKEFIDCLSSKNDFMAIVKELNWNEIYNSYAMVPVDSINILTNYLNDAADAFVSPLTLLDAFTTQDVLLDLSGQLSIISSLLGAVDGNFSEEEANIFQYYCNELILGKWADCKGLVAVEDNTENNTEDNSLYNVGNAIKSGI